MSEWNGHTELGPEMKLYVNSVCIPLGSLRSSMRTGSQLLLDDQLVGSTQNN